jgi:hypothetical protein
MSKAVSRTAERPAPWAWALLAASIACAAASVLLLTWV